MGSYFGSSLCAVDLNTDGLSDLLVGAPMFSEIRDRAGHRLHQQRKREYRAGQGVDRVRERNIALRSSD